MIDKIKYPLWAIILTGIVILLVASIPFVGVSPYVLHIFILFFLYTILGQSWNILGGYTGQYSVGHAAYFGTGAYVTLSMIKSYGLPPWLGMALGIPAAIIVALVIGLICFRLIGPYFVLASIALTEMIRLSAINLKSITNGAEGILVTDIPPLMIGDILITDYSTKVPFFYTMYGFVLVTLILTYLVSHSKLGYYFQAIREDQDAAHSLGINLTVYKNIALILSAIFTSIAGSLYGVYIGFIEPGTVLSLDMSVQIVLICIIGGIGTIWGPMIGALVLVALSESLRANIIAKGLFQIGLVLPDSKVGVFLHENLAHAHVLIYGILVVIVILFMPDGVFGFLKKITKRLRTGGSK